MHTIHTNDLAGSLITKLTGIKNELAKLISQFDDNQFNQVPFEGSWTASQVVDHIRKSVKGIPSVLSGNSGTAGRVPDEKFDIIRKIFLDFEARYKAPEFIIPAEAYHRVNDLLERVNKAFDAIITKSASIDLSLIYSDYEIPNMGKFTGLEWIEFVSCHTQRHINQLKNIYQLVTV